MYSKTLEFIAFMLLAIAIILANIVNLMQTDRIDKLEKQVINQNTRIFNLENKVDGLIFVQNWDWKFPLNSPDFLLEKTNN